MRIPSGSVDRYINFVALNASRVRQTGKTGFTVWRSRNGAAPAAMSAPTVVELSAGNMPGVYALLLNEDTTLDPGHDTEEMVLHIAHADMLDVDRTVELYRPKATEGETITASGGSVSGVLVVGTVVAVGSDGITAGSIAAGAMDGKGDWNVGKTGYSIAGAKTTLDALNDVSAAEVNAEVVDVIDTDLTTLPGQEAPPASPTLRGAIAYLYKFLRNRVTSTADEVAVYNEAGSAIDHKSPHSDDGTTYSRAKFISGP